MAAIEDEVFTELANLIIKRMSAYTSYNKKPSEKSLANDIYEFGLTKRYSDRYLNKIFNKFYAKKADKFNETLENLNFPNTAILDKDGYWFHIVPKIRSDRIVKRKAFGLFRVTYKLYFTLKLSKEFEHSFKEIIRFIEGLPKLHTWLYKLSINN